MDRLEESGQPVRLLGLVTLGALGRVDAAVTGAVELIDGEVGSVELAGALGHELARLGWRRQGVDFLSALIDRLEAADRSTEAAAARRDLAELYAAGDQWAQLAQLLERRVEGGDLGQTLLYADALSHLGRGAEALAVLAANPAAADGTPSPMAKRAEVLYRLDREQEALELLRSLTRRQEPEARMEAVRTYQRLELYDNAIPVLEQMVAENPQSKEATYYLGAAYERTGRPDRAASIFNRLLTVDPQFAPALNYLGYMWAERGENLDQALSLVNRALAVEPDNGAYIDSLGWTHFQRGDLDRARFHLERAARLLPDDPTVMEHLGDVYSRLGDAEQARRSYQRSLELGAEDSDALRLKLEELETRQ
jgi:tetratricopeptide (TPR) repeat protein